MRNKRAPRLAALAIAVVAIAGLLAACGSSSSTSSSASSSSAAAGTSGSGSGSSASRSANRAKLLTCLKQHGVTLPSRPAGSGSGGSGGGGTPGSAPSGGYGGAGRGFFGGGTGGFQANPKLRAAFQACGGGRGFGRPGGSRISHAAIDKFVSCVKQHGYTLPKPNFSGKGSVFPASIEKNAKFQAASKACRSALMPPGGAPPNGTTTSG